MPSVGLALIVKDEEANLPKLLASIEGAFDQVVLLDTGSTDRTVDIFIKWAKENEVDFKVDNFNWVHDFSAARNAADAMLDTDWNVWADADDVLIGAQNIRAIIEQTPPHIVGYICDYDYVQHPDTGHCLCTLKRERLMRNGAGHWIGRVHEAQTPKGQMDIIGPELLLWKHQKLAQELDEAEAAAVQSNDRNLDILKKWNEDEPDNPRIVGYLGTELAVQAQHDEAIKYYKHYIELDSEWTEERAQIHRKLAASLMAVGQWDEALRYGLEALHVLPQWPDSYITLAQVYNHRGEWAKAAFWAARAVEMGVPGTLLIINPMDYTFVARAESARALAGMGRHEQAIVMTEQALSIFPDGALAQESMVWRQALRREKTAETFVMCAQQLVGHDEQQKARILLEQCVPHFATDHPAIVQMRSTVRERLLWVDDAKAFEDHYTTGGSKPEDFVPDDQVDELCGYLPRAQFLLEGVKEQVNG